MNIPADLRSNGKKRSNDNDTIRQPYFTGYITNLRGYYLQS